MTRVELTSREITVVRELASGRSDIESAVAFGTAEATVMLHVSRLQEKLSTQNRTEALAAARRWGLVRLT